MHDESMELLAHQLAAEGVVVDALQAMKDVDNDHRC